MGDDRTGARRRRRVPLLRSLALWPAKAWRGLLARLANRGLGRIPFALPAYRLLRSLLLRAGLPVPTRAGSMRLDPRDALQLLERGVYEVERYETELFEGEIREGDVVLDLGAHIGYYTLLAAARVGDAGRVISFEPNPANFSLLERNVRLNGYGNVILHRKAVSDRTYRGRLYLSADNSGDHRIFDAEGGRPSIEIDVVRPDELLSEFRGRIRLVKMDLQGAEGLALRGVRGLIEGTGRLAMITEFSPDSMGATGVAPERFLEELRELGLTIYRIDERERRLVLLERGWSEFPAGGEYLNLLCRREGAPEG